MDVPSTVRPPDEDEAKDALGVQCESTQLLREVVRESLPNQRLEVHHGLELSYQFDQFSCLGSSDAHLTKSNHFLRASSFPGSTHRVG
jgi:hypothetical protein